MRNKIRITANETDFFLSDLLPLHVLRREGGDNGGSRVLGLGADGSQEDFLLPQSHATGARAV